MSNTKKENNPLNGLAGLLVGTAGIYLFSKAFKRKRFEEQYITHMVEQNNTKESLNQTYITNKNKQNNKRYYHKQRHMPNKNKQNTLRGTPQRKDESIDNKIERTYNIALKEIPHTTVKNNARKGKKYDAGHPVIKRQNNRQYNKVIPFRNIESLINTTPQNREAYSIRGQGIEDAIVMEYLISPWQNNYKTVSQICKDNNISRYKLYKIINKRNIYKRSERIKDHARYMQARAISLHNENLPVKMIAEQLNVSTSTIYRYLKRAEKEAEQRKYTRGKTIQGVMSY